MLNATAALPPAEVPAGMIPESAPPPKNPPPPVTCSYKLLSNAPGDTDCVTPAVAAANAAFLRTSAGLSPDTALAAALIAAEPATAAAAPEKPKALPTIGANGG